jgi:hypothetical protein
METLWCCQGSHQVESLPKLRKSNQPNFCYFNRAGDKVLFIEAIASDTQGVLKSVREGKLTLHNRP